MVNTKTRPIRKHHQTINQIFDKSEDFMKKYNQQNYNDKHEDKDKGK